MSEPKYIDKLAPLIAMATMECQGQDDASVRDDALQELQRMARLADEYSDYLRNTGCLSLTQGMVDKVCQDLAYEIAHRYLLHEPAKVRDKIIGGRLIIGKELENMKDLMRWLSAKTDYDADKSVTTMMLNQSLGK